MNDLLKSQVKQNLRLSLPEGLLDLMADISREVLRAQPPNLLAFITNYLSALLVTRENLKVTSCLCDSVAENLCAEGLGDELRRIGLASEDIDKVVNMLIKHLTNADPGKVVKETYLMSKLVRKTSITADQVPAVQNAIRTTFLKYMAYHTTIYESSSDEDIDDVTRAARHTLKLYRKTNPALNVYNAAAIKIQAAYRAYNLRRKKENAAHPGTEHSSQKSIKFIGCEQENSEDTKSGSSSPRGSLVDTVSEKTEDIFAQYRPGNIHTVSSTSLAGSFITLPRSNPYTAHEGHVLSVHEEVATEEYERENTTIDYTVHEAKEKIYLTFHRDDSMTESVDEAARDHPDVSLFSEPDDDIASETSDDIPDDIYQEAKAAVEIQHEEDANEIKQGEPADDIDHEEPANEIEHEKDEIEKVNEEIEQEREEIYLVNDENEQVQEEISQGDGEIELVEEPIDQIHEEIEEERYEFELVRKETVLIIENNE